MSARLGLRYPCKYDSVVQQGETMYFHCGSAILLGSVLASQARFKYAHRRAYIIPMAVPNSAEVLVIRSFRVVRITEPGRLSC